MMTYEWAKPGVKVVCVNDYQDTVWNKDCSKTPSKNWHIIKGHIYTIRSTFVRTNPTTPLTLRLEGLYRDPVSGTGADKDLENGYSVLRFRPLITKSLPDTLTILLEKPNRMIVPSGVRWDVKRQKDKVR